MSPTRPALPSPAEYCGLPPDSETKELPVDNLTLHENVPEERMLPMTRSSRPSSLMSPIMKTSPGLPASDDIVYDVVTVRDVWLDRRLYQFTSVPRSGRPFTMSGA
jgi:hypothetical protein